MVVRVDPEMLAYMRASSGAIRVLVRGEPAAALRAALGAARSRVLAIEHPEEPGEAFASFVSELEALDDGLSLWFDMADAEAYEGILDLALEAVVTSLEESGVDWATVSFPEGARTEDAAPLPSAPTPTTVPVYLPARFPLPAGAELVETSITEGRHSSQFLIQQPIADLVAFYRAELEAEGYLVTAVTDAGVAEMFKSRHWLEFQRQELLGVLLLTEWNDPPTTLGWGHVRVDTWRAP